MVKFHLEEEGRRRSGATGMSVASWSSAATTSNGSKDWIEYPKCIIIILR